MQFSKYHGIGNDFVVVDLRSGDPESAQDPERASKVCDRRFGVGADGVLPILAPTSDGSDARMRVLNADGSEAEMCGNGIRCVVKHLWEQDESLRKSPLTIDTGAGPLACEVTVEGDQVTAVTVDMGRPRLTRAEIPMAHGGALPAADAQVIEEELSAAGTTLSITAVSMGNPHAIAFVDASGDALRDMATSIGPSVENHEVFPNRTNAEFAHVVSPTEIELVVWERGSGLTMACGTGACATVVAACLTDRAKPGTEVAVHLPGGPLYITVAEDMSTVFMRGPAAHVFDAEIDLGAL